MRALMPIACVVLVACGVPASAGEPSAAPVTATIASPSPSPLAIRGLPPVTAGAAVEAGVLFVRGSDDWIYRYDGATGQLSPAIRHSTIQRSTSVGAYAEGLEGGLQLLRWNGTIEAVDCGPGRFQLVGPRDACLSYTDTRSSRSVWIRLSGEAPRPFLSGDWGAGEMTWSPDARNVAVLRSSGDQSLRTRLHNALWMVAVGGASRLIYEPPSAEAFLFGLGWSPDGRWLTVWEQPIVSNSLGADGDHLLLIDATSGTASDLGVTLANRRWLQWSSDGRLAYVKGGGRETWREKELVVLAPGGAGIPVTDRGHVGLAPAWEPPPTGSPALFWVEAEVGDGNGGVYVAGTGPGARYGVEKRAGTAPQRLPIGQIVEGLRPSDDGRVTLTLIRRPTQPPVHDEQGALELWLTNPSTAAQVRLISGLGDLAFGFYGSQPSLFDLVAWSRDPR